MNDTLFYRLLGAFVFGGENELWKTLSGEEREELCRLAAKRKLGPLFYRKLSKALPAPYAAEFVRQYRNASARALFEQMEWKRLSGLLKKENIRFAPVKGLDMALRFYPDPALRPHADWDILFHPDDIQRARAILEANGWTHYADYRDSNPGEHHFEPLYRQGLMLEPHWNLPNVSNLTPQELWSKLEKGTDGIYRLTAEWNLILLIAHGTNHDFCHVPPWKILPDAGFLLQKETVDWEKVHEIAGTCDVFSPDLFLGAWKEFFPAGKLPPEADNPEAAALIRALGEAGHGLAENPYERLMNKSGKFTVRWFLDRLDIYLHPYRMLRKYNIREKSIPLFLRCAMKDFCEKAVQFFRSAFRKDPGSRNYYEVLDKLHALDQRRKAARRH